MSTTMILHPGVGTRRGTDRHQTRIGWPHGRRLGAAEPGEVLIREMHACLSPAISI